MLVCFLNCHLFKLSLLFMHGTNWFTGIQFWRYIVSLVFLQTYFTESKLTVQIHTSDHSVSSIQREIGKKTLMFSALQRLGIVCTEILNQQYITWIQGESSLELMFFCASFQYRLPFLTLRTVCYLLLPLPCWVYLYWVYCFIFLFVLSEPEVLHLGQASWPFLTSKL